MFLHKGRRRRKKDKIKPTDVATDKVEVLLSRPPRSVSPAMNCDDAMNWFLRFQGPKWLVTIIVCGVSLIIGHYVDPYCKGFHWSDQSINMPFASQEEFPNWSLPIIVGIPVFVFALVVLIAPRKRFMFPPQVDISPRVSMWLEINQWALIQGQALMFQLMFVDTMKVFAGRLRPDFLDRLRQAGISPPANLNDLQYNCETISMSSTLRDGRLSFPSGHSSTSFGAMVPLCFFLAFHLRPVFHACVLRCIVSLSPIYLAFFVAVSRTRDNRHHFADILGGSVIGIAGALIAVGLNLRFNEDSGIYIARGIQKCDSMERPMLPLQPTGGESNAATAGENCA